MEVIGKLFYQVLFGSEWELQVRKCRLGKEFNKLVEFFLQKEIKIVVINDFDFVLKKFFFDNFNLIKI